MTRPSSHLTELHPLAKIRFFPRSSAPTLAEVAGWCGAALAADADAGRVIHDVAALDQAGPGDLTFLDNPKYLDVFRTTRAAAALVAPRFAAAAPRGCAALVAREPYRAMASVMANLYPSATKPGSVFDQAGVSPRRTYTLRRASKRGSSSIRAPSSGPAPRSAPAR